MTTETSTPVGSASGKLYRTIVVGTDGSPLATSVIERAGGIAARDGADLVIVSAWTGLNPRSEASGPSGVGVGAVVGRLPSRAAASKALAEATSLANSLDATVASTLLVDGDAARALINTAQERGADLIVMGAYSRPSLTERLLGDVASEVVRTANCDVLIVRPLGDEGDTGAKGSKGADSSTEAG